MNSDLILGFTIILSFIGICISVAALIFSIIYLIRLNSVSRIQMGINESFKIIDDIKAILISQCCWFSDDGIIKGKNAIKMIMDQEGLDEINAIKFYYNHNIDEKK